MTTEERIAQITAHAKNMAEWPETKAAKLLAGEDVPFLLEQLAEATAETMQFATELAEERILTQQLTAERDQLAAAIARVRDLHKPEERWASPFTNQRRMECTGSHVVPTAYPCDEITALDGQEATDV